MAAFTPPALLTTGAATPQNPAIRSPRLIAKPCLRMSSSSASRSSRLPIDIGVNFSREAATLSTNSGGWNANIAFPVDEQ